MQRAAIIRFSLFLLTLALLFLIGNGFDLSALTGAIARAPIAHQEGGVALTFCQAGDCDAALLGPLRAADDIKCAFYDLEYAPLEALLAEKAERGEADILLFEENHDGARHPFATPVPARHGGLMHNKFCILDGRAVITGSMNPTENGILRNDNNLLLIEGNAIAENYLQEYAELAGGAERPVPHPVINHSNTTHDFLLENRFCPEDGCERELLAALEAATATIHFMTFSFTSDPIGDLLVEKAAEGVAVSGVFERRQESQYSEYRKLLDAGIDVRLDGNPATMHHKLFLIDARDPERATVILGSYNPTRNGDERNDENMLIIRDAGLAGRFLDEFARVWVAAR